MIISLKRIQEEYPWITKSTLFDELIKDSTQDEDIMNAECEYQVCGTCTDIKKLFYVLNFWGVYEVPFEILERLAQENTCEIIDFLMELITDCSLKVFVIKYIHFVSSLGDNISFSGNMAKYGYLDILKWGKHKGFKLKGCSYEAAEFGHTHVLEWLYENNYKFESDELSIAIKNGHYDTVVWLYNHNINQTINNHRAMISALKTDNIRMINYIYIKFKNDGYNLTPDFYNEICSKGKIQGYDWLYEKGILPVNKTLNKCVINKRIDLLKWCYEHGLKAQSSIYSLAIQTKSLHIVKWFYDRNVLFSEGDLNTAICGSTLEIMNFLYEKGCRFNDDTQEIFTEFRIDLEKLKWMVDHDFEIIENVIENIIISNQPAELFEWLSDNNFFINKDLVLNTAIRNEETHALDVLFRGMLKLDNSFYKTAINSDSLFFMNYLYKNGVKPDSNTYLDAYNHPRSVKYFDWLYDHECEIPEEFNIIINNNLYIKQWLEKKRSREEIDYKRKRVENDYKNFSDY